jgi:hypothetical protein
MAKRLDIEKVRNALKQAARNAVSGSRELRFGRFILLRTEWSSSRVGIGRKAENPSIKPKQ